MAVRAGRGPRRARIALAAFLAVGAPLAIVLVFLLRGGAWYVVETPSMGTAAPVGTLVVSAPVRAADLRPGDVVTYSPPLDPDGTITHRVVAVQPDGFRTRGDVNGGVDPWVVTAAEVRGRAVALVPGAGWLVRSLPALLGGLAIVMAVAAFVPDRALRTAVRLLGCSAVVCAVVLVTRPLVNAAVTMVLVGPAGTQVRLVGTGLLPVRVQTGGRFVDLTSGQPGLLRLPAGTASHLVLSTGLHLAPWGWAAFAAVCAVPVGIAAVRVLRAEPPR